MDSAISFSNIIYLVLVVLIVMALRSAIKVVPQSEIGWLSALANTTARWKPVCMC